MLDKNVRCDGCGAEAWVSVKKTVVSEVNPTGKKQLDFCAHHYQEHSILLHAEGWAISNDERDRINVKPSVSANAD